MMSVLFKSALAVAAAAGLAYTSADDLTGSPYDDGEVKSLNQAALEDHAAALFQRADRNQDSVLDADEYATLAIVSAELSRLNGFVVIEGEQGPATLKLASARPASLGAAEHARIGAVSRAMFYAGAGDDAKMSEAEFIASQRAIFDAADFNGNGVLHRGELAVFAGRQAMTLTGA